MQEVRRFHPFVRLVGGRVMQPFTTWREHRVAEGDRVMLDIYGTNRDPAAWHPPERFSPQRGVGALRFAGRTA